MGNWDYYYNSDSGSDKLDTMKNSPYYKESYKKKKRKSHGMLFQMVVVAIISSILGGAIVGSLLIYYSPNMQVFAKEAPEYSGQIEDFAQGENEHYQNTSNVEGTTYVPGLGDSPVTHVAEIVSPSIVGIRSIPDQQELNNYGFFFFQQQQSVSPSEGSGIIIKSDGYIITNYHVIANALDSKGQLSNGAKIDVYLSNQMEEPYEAKVIDYDRKSDLAIIKIHASELPAAKLGDSDKLKVGEIAVAIGNPGGLEYMGSVTSGVISGLNRTVYVEDRELKLIQTDAAINPGNSGGALCNAKGEVIGVNTVKMASVEFEGLGFAIPINTAKKIAESLINETPIEGRAPRIGVSIDPRYTEEVAKANNLPIGLYIYDVSFMSGAYKIGLQTGDIITEFDGKTTRSFDELEERKNKHKPGDVVKIKIYRHSSSEYLEFDLTLGEDRG